MTTDTTARAKSTTRNRRLRYDRAGTGYAPTYALLPPEAAAALALCAERYGTRAVAIAIALVREARRLKRSAARKAGGAQ